MDALDEHTKLLARADAAIAEARRLIEANRESQEGTGERLRRMYFRSMFYPKSIRIYSPQDFPEPRRSHQHSSPPPDEP